MKKTLLAAAMLALVLGGDGAVAKGHKVPRHKVLRHAAPALATMHPIDDNWRLVLDQPPVEGQKRGIATPATASDPSNFFICDLVDTDATCRASAGLGKASPEELQAKEAREKARVEEAEAKAEAARKAREDADAAEVANWKASEAKRPGWHVIRKGECTRPEYGEAVFKSPAEDFEASKQAAAFTKAFSPYASVPEPTLVDNGDEVIIKKGDSDFLASRYYRTEEACQTRLAVENAEAKARRDAQDAAAHKLDKYR
jgi:hypothetical protein